MGETGAAHLVSDLVTPFDHFRDCLLVHSLTGLPYGIDDREIGL